MENQLLLVDPSKFGIQESSVKTLIGNLPEIKTERDELVKEFNSVVTLDIEDKSTSKIARELRLKIKDNRTKGLEVWHTKSKEFFLKGGQFIDAIKREESAINKEMEDKLSEIENYFEIKEKERKAKLNAERIEMLEPYNSFVPIGLNFGEISEDEFQKVLNGAKLQYKQMIEEEEKAEAERIRLAEIERLNSVRRELAMPYYFFWSEHEKQINFGEQTEGDFTLFLDRIKKAKADDDLKQEEIRKENERLAKEKQLSEEKAKKEREEAERKLQQQREEQEEALRKEREKQAKLEAEIEAKRKAEQEAENKRNAEEAERKKEAEKLAKAPIKNQLNAWVNSFEIPETSVDNDTSKLIKEKFNAFKDWSLSQIEKL